MRWPVLSDQRPVRNEVEKFSGIRSMATSSQINTGHLQGHYNVSQRGTVWHHFAVAAGCQFHRSKHRGGIRQTVHQRFHPLFGNCQRITERRQELSSAIPRLEVPKDGRLFAPVRQLRYRRTIAGRFDAIAAETTSLMTLRNTGRRSQATGRRQDSCKLEEEI